MMYAIRSPFSLSLSLFVAAMTLAATVEGTVAASSLVTADVTTVRASTFSRSQQFEATVGATTNDTFVVAWTSRRQQGGTAGVYLQRFDADGAAIGSETQVNLWTSSMQASPAIAPLADGGFVVVWTSFGQDGDAGSIVARRFNAEGLGGDEMLVNTQVAGEQSAPVVASHGNGEIAFAWLTHADERAAVVFRRMQQDGTWSDEQQLAVGASVRTPSIAMLKDGSPLVTWTSDRADGATIIEKAVVGSQPGDIIRDEILADAFEGTLLAYDDGALLAWNGPAQHGESAMPRAFAQRLDAHGCPIGARIALGDGVAPAPVRTPSGFAVATTRDEPAEDGTVARHVWLQNFDTRGAAIGTAQPLTLDLPGEQSLRLGTGSSRIAAALRKGAAPDAGPMLAVAWDGDGGKGDSHAVHLSLVGERSADAKPAGIDPAAVAAADTDIGAGPEGASPHIPPTFDPRSADHGRRTITVDDIDIGFDVVLDTGWTPPDCNLAVGPEHVIAITNGAISFFTKNGQLTFSDAIEGGGGFWGSVGATSFVFDPECFYDTLHNRYWAMASEGNAPGGKSFVLLAISDDSDPNGTWFKYRIETTSIGGSIFDSPNIAIDSQAVYVTGDGSNGNYQLFTWDVASLLVGDPPAISKQLNIVTGPESAGISPVTEPGTPALYMLEHKEAASNTKVKFFAVTNPLTTPQLTTTEITVPTYGPPEDAPQQGTAVEIESFDARFWSVDYKNGSFWATHHINSDRVLVRWYEFAMNGWPASGKLPELKQVGTIDPGPGVRTHYSAIGADDAGNAVLTFARSSPNEFLSMCTTFRTPTDPPNTMRPSTVVKSNVTPYTEANRWGDYAAARHDPASTPGSPVFWANHEYATNPSNWRSWAQRMTLPGPSADLDGDGDVDAADLAILLGTWGGPGVADLNLDGTVDAADLAILLGAWT